MSLSAPAVVFLILCCVLLPMMALRTAWHVTRPGGAPGRSRFLVSVFVSQGLTLMPALIAARYEGIDLFPTPTPEPSDLAILLAFLIPALVTLPMRWRWKTPAEKHRVLWMLPHAGGDLWWWAIVSLVAGIAEEIVYRGVLLTLVWRILPGWWTAVLVCVMVFTVAHLVQGWRAMIVVALTALVFHLMVRFTGDLYTAMIGHFVYDMLAGLVLMRCARAEGLTREPGEAPR